MLLNWLEVTKQCYLRYKKFFFFFSRETILPLPPTSVPVYKFHQLIHYPLRIVVWVSKLIHYHFKRTHYHSKHNNIIPMFANGSHLLQWNTEEKYFWYIVHRNKGAVQCKFDAALLPCPEPSFPLNLDFPYSHYLNARYKEKQRILRCTHKSYPLFWLQVHVKTLDQLLV